jgi:hypothetical protein
MGIKAINLPKLALEAFNRTTADPKRVQQIDTLGARIDMLIDFVYGYTDIDDPSLDTGDEIINWTFVDVADDLNAANWNVSCGFYKTGASCLRNALDIATVALYFQIRENTNGMAGGYNRFFTEWDRGDRDTPNWGEMTSIIKRETAIQSFNNRYSCNIIDEAYDHFKYLCNFTHSRPFDRTSGRPTNSIWLGSDTPDFDAATFERLMSLAEETIAWIATLWLTTFPGILSTDPLNDSITYAKYEQLLSHSRGREALIFAR